MALKIKVIVGDDEDNDADDTQLTTEPRKKTPHTIKRRQTNPRPVCLHLRQSIDVNFKWYESRLPTKVYTEAQTSLIIYIYLELGGAAQRRRKKK